MNTLLKKEKIQVKKDTIRDLIDVEDLPKIVEFCIDKNINGIINTSLENKIKVIDIIDYFGNFPQQWETRKKYYKKQKYSNYFPHTIFNIQPSIL